MFDFFKYLAHQFFCNIPDIFFFDKAHFNIDLCKLRLTVCT